MVAPIITITSFTRSKIGKVSGVDKAIVTFTTNQHLLEWEARADGSGVGQGLLVGEQKTPIEDGYALKLKNPWNEVLADQPNWNQLGNETFNSISYGSASFEVDDSELTWGDKSYAINVYGKNEFGEWTPFGRVNLLDQNPSFEEGLWSQYSSNGTTKLVTGWNGVGKAARIDVTGTSSGAIGLISSGNFSLTEGDVITISFMARAKYDNFPFNYRYLFSTSSGNKSLGIVYIGLQWKQYQEQYIVPVGESATDYRLMMGLYRGRQGIITGDWVEIDDVSIVKEGG